MSKAPIEKRLAHLISRHAMLSERVSRFARHYMDLGTNFNYDNGEAWLISTMAALNPRIIVDIGANVGDWTLRAVRQFPDAKVFSFEPNPPIYAELVNNSSAFPGVSCVPAAVSPNKGKFPLFIRTGREHIGVSSLTKYSHHDTSIIISAVNGDDWLKERGIDAIDFLKIDVEGQELNVLKAFDKALSTKKVRVVQFEFAVPNPHERIFLKDIYDFAEPLGYLIGRLYSNFVLFKQYEIRDEWWHGPNYVMCRKDDQIAETLLSNRSGRVFYMEHLSMS